MEPFEFFSLGRVVFGRGTIARVGELTAKLGRRALLVTNAGQPGDGGLSDVTAGKLADAGVDVHSRLQSGEPTVEDVEQALAQARQAACDVVLGLGGGSAIDAAKAVAGLLTNGGSPLDYMEVIGLGRPLTMPAAPWIAVPTTAGTGAEATRNAVIGCPEKRFKASLRSEHLLARVALVDPELTAGLPPDVTARTGMDALCQLIESYTSNRAEPITDALAVQGVTLAARALPRAFADGHDIAAREALSLAALLSGLTLMNVGLGAVHGFAAPLGANFPVPHGTVCAALLPPVLAANIAALRKSSEQHPCLERYATIGRIMAEDGTLDRESACQACVQRAETLVRQLGIPSLREFGIVPARFPELIALARQASSMRSNPVVLSDEELLGILDRACW